MAEFKPDENETPVIFRAQREAGTLWITAVFPCEPATLQGDTFTIYQHVGQHGAGSYGWYQRTRAATPAEYADLKRELESAPYGYRLKVYKRMTRGHREALRAEASRLRGRA
jgi:hypothetical protein